MSELGWYLRRLARMSPPEILHRVREQLRKRIDRRRHYDWNQFETLGGALRGLPGLDSVLAQLPPIDPQVDLSRPQFRFLNQDWPLLESDWGRRIWFLDPVTGSSWPGADRFTFDVPYRHAADKGDVKFVWELNRLQFLQRAARDAGTDAEKWKHVCSLLRAWMAANPPFRGINWNSGIEAASRLVSLLVVLALADDAHRAELEALARPFLGAHTYWLHRYPSLFSSANNHRVSELVALFLAGLCAPSLPQAQEHVTEGQRQLEEEILKQFHADGVGAEQSPAYASYSLEWFVLAGMAGDALHRPFSQAYRTRVHAALEHLTWMQDDVGNTPNIGDDDEGRVLGFHSEAYVRSVCTLAAAWLGIAPPRPAGARTFAEGGYTTIREPGPQGTMLAVLDHGPLGFLSIAAHGHADALSLWLHWGDEPVLVDAGTYLYHAGQGERDRFRGTSAHNTLAIDGKDQSVIAGAFNWSRHARTRIVAVSEGGLIAECDGYAALGILHHRRLTHPDKGILTVEDMLSGPGLGDCHMWEAGFLIAPGIAVMLSDEVANLTTPKGRRLKITLASGQSWQLTTAAHSAGFNLCTETMRLAVQGRTKASDAAAPLLKILIAASH